MSDTSRGYLIIVLYQLLSTFSAVTHHHAAVIVSREQLRVVHAIDGLQSVMH